MALYVTNKVYPLLWSLLGKGVCTHINGGTVTTWLVLAAIWKAWFFIELVALELGGYWWMFVLASYLRVMHLNLRKSSSPSWTLFLTMWGQVAVSYTICTLFTWSMGSMMDYLCHSSLDMEKVIPQSARSWNLVSLMYGVVLISEMHDPDILIASTVSNVRQALWTFWGVFKVIPHPHLIVFLWDMAFFYIGVMLALVFSFSVGFFATTLAVLCVNLCMKVVWVLDIYAKVAVTSFCRILSSAVRIMDIFKAGDDSNGDCDDSLLMEDSTVSVDI